MPEPRAPAAQGAGVSVAAEMAQLLQGYSIEVMPRTAAKITDFRTLLPAGTRVYIAHIEGTPIAEMVQTARRLTEEGFAVMPHFPARLITDQAMLENWIARYQGEAGIDQALLLAGGVAKPYGGFHCSMQLLQTGCFGKAGFRHLHVAGHPEGNRDIDPDGSTRQVDEALRWKAAFSRSSDAKMAVVTQFVFDAKPVIQWAQRLHAAAIDLPLHIGIAGPAKLQTLIKYAIACGVGPSLNVLKRRALDLSKLLTPYAPDSVVADLARNRAAHPHSPIAQVHFFPLGGIKACTDWAHKHSNACNARPKT
ncbi:MAG: methylenetetrahydrofolate reductase [Rhodobacteraceae bacterium]|nr:methylenetetrahydrofolate reductase [Paracoccaceae bacterium]